MFFGFALQPIVTAATAFVLFPFVEMTGEPLYGGSLADPLAAAAGFGLVNGVLGLFVTVFAAVPLFSWLSSRAPLKRGTILAAGVLLGNLPSALITITLAARYALPWYRFTYGAAGLLRIVIFGSLLGLAGAGTFWCVAGSYIAENDATDA